MPHKLTDSLSALSLAAAQSLMQTASLSNLENWRIHYLGRKGEIPRLLREVKNLPPADRQIIGQQGNQLRHDLTAAYEKKLLSFSGQLASAPASRPAQSPVEVRPGHLHPLTLAGRDLQTIFYQLGFQLVEGPLVEETKYNFDLLNIPLEHPARAETDTFHLPDGLVLRTHTSPVQLRSVLANGLVPPFQVYSIGRTFRAERTDASHDHTFSQIEALMVGDAISIADFKGVVEYVYSNFFRQSVATRLRPSYFPFVEPGFEVDMSCVICQQKGCRVCQQTGWLEMMGAGMVHPNVLRNMNIDHHKYQGFAFGGGIERLAMLRHSIPDVRLFQSGDLKFLRQFS
ncbi:MAG TPA: phenylalanine--tRNA ligase subunit alpha [Candidatus Andersenbacteria bacterium]|nr:MAG: Phenylalanine-tRNA ligase alpha subunit [Parcubacteria group bacterium GW2011_GWA2_45_14]OGY35120.1 MAG: phenylalanine--tRNA ligase subunit alpha [Candidatus Andersenbacteria bacterium RIFCSPHIGHO2_02_FULL_46_16]HBE90056.1 phenylalanine--tRNA ligase subunit alpha [Candidatus Andersenbacteria bacterium]